VGHRFRFDVKGEGKRRLAGSRPPRERETSCLGRVLEKRHERIRPDGSQNTKWGGGD